jgi:maleate isomerase
MARPARIGMIVPSSNTCLEPQTYRILGDRQDVTVHFTRIEVSRIALDENANTQFDPATMVDAANLLRAAEVDVIAWNGTAGSWLGVEHDRTMVDSITGATGIPATTSTLAYLEAFEKFGINRFGLVSPYTADVNEAIVQQYARIGIAVAGERHLGLSVNESFARVDPQVLLQVSLELAGAVDQQDAAAPDALVYLCTNLYGAPIVDDVETRTGLPALDSVAVTLWRCMAMAGAGGLEKRWGRLLT